MTSGSNQRIVIVVVVVVGSCKYIFRPKDLLAASAEQQRYLARAEVDEEGEKYYYLVEEVLILAVHLARTNSVGSVSGSESIYIQR